MYAILSGGLNPQQVESNFGGVFSEGYDVVDPARNQELGNF